jgi:putative ATPase
MEHAQPGSRQPLAAKIRPKTLDDFVGQAHLVGEGKPLRVAVERGARFSFVLWGPPGVGKTTLARIYAESLGARFHELSAVSAGKDDVRQIAALGAAAPQVLFLDEIHRFNTAQQDFLLPFVESGALILVGATTENPSFEVNAALLSRCRVFTLEPLSDEEIGRVLDRAGVEIPADSREWLVRLAGGDARAALSALDASLALYGDAALGHLREAAAGRGRRYDKKGEEHHNVVSAFIKSMRAGDADAAVYYLARMVSAGEDPKFIARRMVVFASEDVGLAQPTALVVADAAFRAVESVGMPEARINLAHAAVYLAQAKKDRRAYDAIGAALAEVDRSGDLPVPLRLRNAPTKLMKDSGYGAGYEMYPETGSCLPEAIAGKRFLP